MSIITLPRAWTQEKAFADPLGHQGSWQQAVELCHLPHSKPDPWCLWHCPCCWGASWHFCWRSVVKRWHMCTWYICALSVQHTYTVPCALSVQRTYTIPCALSVQLTYNVQWSILSVQFGALSSLPLLCDHCHLSPEPSHKNGHSTCIKRPLPGPETLETIIQLSDSLSLTALSALLKWSRAMFVLGCLAYFT